MLNPECEDLMRRVRNALAILSCNIPNSKKEIVEEIEKIREMASS